MAESPIKLMFKMRILMVHNNLKSLDVKELLSRLSRLISGDLLLQMELCSPFSLKFHSKVNAAFKDGHCHVMMEVTQKAATQTLHALPITSTLYKINWLWELQDISLTKCPLGAQNCYSHS